MMGRRSISVLGGGRGWVGGTCDQVIQNKPTALLVVPGEEPESHHCFVHSIFPLQV